MKRLTFIVTLLLIVLFTASLAAAKVEKFTFNDVTFPDGTTGEIEAGSKITNKSTYTTCSYYSDDYADYLGQYADDTFASTDAAEVLAFCLDHYDDRA